MLLATSLLALCSLISALALTPLTRDIFLRLGLVDRPTGGRKIHSAPIPRAGGISIVASIGLAIGLTAALGVWEPFLYNPAIQFLIRLLPAAAIIFVVGALDDIINLQPWQKLLGQLLAAGLAYTAGLRVLGFGGNSSESWITLPLTIGWLLLCTNAFNLIDGVDGLASGVGLFATLTMLVAGILDHDSALVLAVVPLGAALLGFLLYNFNPATVFLGDSGSLLLGFLLGCFGVIWGRSGASVNFKTATVFGMAPALMAMFVPILDVTLSICRRFLRGQPIFGADRGHVHHRLLDRGLTPRRVVFLLYGACAFGAILALLQSGRHHRYGDWVVLLFCAGAWLGIQQLRYAEFRAVRKMVTGGTLQRIINMNVQQREFENAIDACESFEQLWEQLCEQCRAFGFAAAKLNFAGQVFEEKFVNVSPGCWRVVITMGERVMLYLSVPPAAAHNTSMMMSLAGRISNKLPQRNRILEYKPAALAAFSGQ